MGKARPVKIVVHSASGEVRTYYMRVHERGVYSTIAGPLRGDRILEALPAGVVEASRGRVIVLEPTWIELLEHFGSRRTQVIYPKDSAYIAVRTGLRPGSTVLEAGVGSGFLTSVAASIVCPTGRIIAYELREEFAENARRNLDLAGFSGCVEIRLGDVREAADLPPVDAVLLDLPDPWSVLESLEPHIRPGVRGAAFLPTTSQVEKLLDRAPAGWSVVGVEEILLREWEPRAGALRPSPRMIGHTGFIVFLARVRV